MLNLQPPSYKLFIETNMAVSEWRKKAQNIRDNARLIITNYNYFVQTDVIPINVGEK